ncbi:MAG: class I SAM-dependent methyltransferase [Sedimentisphaerales bacterium]|nr:class I SAM-dependent methyltransferase [Sedimentisphaerales bacterium]
MSTTDNATAVAMKRWDRNAPIYDLMEGLIERLRFQEWRPLLWSKVEGIKILEVGVGTGKNFPYYPPEADITAIDFSEKMIEQAKRRPGKFNLNMNPQQMDVQNLQFEDNTFDTVIGSCIFCSVPDPIKGLREVQRVCKSGGKVVLLEHVLHANRVIAFLMNLANPLVVRMVGPNINRRTVENAAQIGLAIERVTELWLGIFKLIEARKN